MFYLKSCDSRLCLLIFCCAISLLGRHSVLSAEISSDNEYEDQSSDESINLIDTIGDELLESGSTESTSGENVLLFWAKLVTDLSDKLWDKLLPIFVKHNNKATNISHECTGSLFKIILSARKQETWAIKFIDSIGKPSSGLLEGRVTTFGNMNECIDIDVEGDEYDEGFRGKYCLLYLKIRLPPKPAIIRHNDRVFNISGTEVEGTVFEYLDDLSAAIYSVGAFRLGVCLPSNCENWEIKPLLTRIFQRYRLEPELSQKCLSKQNRKPLTIHQKVSIGLISSMALLVLTSTLFHWMFGSNHRNILIRLLHSWSLSKNMSELFYSSPKSNKNMPSLNGIKVLTMYWMIIAHNYMFGGFYLMQWTFKNLVTLKEVPQSLMFQLIFNGWPLVETFFFIGGLLFIHSNQPVIDKSKGKPSIIALILHRLVRIVPTLCGVIAINFLWPLFTTGPILIDDTIDKYVTKSCQNNWWKTLLLINNWSDPGDICLLTTWYLSADFQLFLSAIIILFALHWNKTFGLILNGMVLIISIICSALMTYYKELYPTILNVHTINIDYFNKHLKYGYFPFYQHLGPYCLGIFTGYLLLKKPNNFKIGKAKNLMGWICFPLISLSVLLAAYPWNNGLEPTPITSMLYSSLSRTVWCIGLSWITYNCCIGSGGIVDRILSHPMFVPLNRLSFGAYLSQLIVIYIIFFTKKSVTDWTHFDFICNGIITIILSNVISLVLYLSMEAPFVNIEKVFLNINESKSFDQKLNKLKERHETNNNDNNDNNNRIHTSNVSHILHITKM